jgi:hypothetical protein
MDPDYGDAASATLKDVNADASTGLRFETSAPAVGFNKKMRGSDVYARPDSGSGHAGADTVWSCPGSVDRLPSSFLEKASHELQVLTEHMNTPMAKAMTELEQEHVDNAQARADSAPT